MGMFDFPSSYISWIVLIDTDGGYGNYSTTSYGGQGGTGGGGFMPGEMNSPAGGRVRFDLF